MMPELGLSVYQSSVTTGELLSLIIRTAREARKLKRECEVVRSHAEVVKRVLDENKQTFQNVEGEKKLREVVEHLLRFVIWCKDANFLQRVWEVAWKKRLPGMIQELKMWVLILSVGTTALARSDLLGLMTNLDRSEEVQRKDTTELMEQVRSQSTILDEMMQVLKEADTPKLQVDFREDDPRLTLEKDPLDDNLLSGKFLTHNLPDSSVKVLCEPVNESIMKYEKGPRHVLIYSKISANAGVHPFYGILERSGSRWTVMKDLRGIPTLAHAIKDGTWPESLPQRLSVAHEVAKTMEYLHSVEVLVKRLSDSTVILESTDGTITPYLTDLESARLFKERTTGGKYDIRYEAPEILTMPKKQHNVYTDIWSLGIFIWQCATGSPPFAFADEVIDGSNSDAAAIRNRTSQGDVLWSKENQDPDPLKFISHLVKRCCNRRPTIRPSATEVVSSLLESMTMLALHSNGNSNGTSSIVGDAVKERADIIVKSKDMDKKLSAEDYSALCRLADAGDMTAAYLRGSAMWRGHIDLDDEVPGGFVAVSEEFREKEIRARAAVVHLEFAFQGGVKRAAYDLHQVHSCLSEIYANKCRQVVALKSL